MLSGGCCVHRGDVFNVREIKEKSKRKQRCTPLHCSHAPLRPPRSRRIALVRRISRAFLRRHDRHQLRQPGCQLERQVGLHHRHSLLLLHGRQLHHGKR